MGVETWGNLVSGLFPCCFLDEDACFVPAAVVLRGGETHVSMMFPHCFHGVSAQRMLTPMRWYSLLVLAFQSLLGAAQPPRVLSHRSLELFAIPRQLHVLCCSCTFRCWTWSCTRAIRPAATGASLTSTRCTRPRNSFAFCCLYIGTNMDAELDAFGSGCIPGVSGGSGGVDVVK